MSVSWTIRPRLEKPLRIYGRPSLCKGFLLACGSASAAAIYPALAITARTVEVFHRGQRVAAHERRYTGRRHGTDPDHMPSAHRRYAEWSPERFRRWARGIGPEIDHETGRDEG
ncbi:hypothetical protein PUR23_28735 [Methylorubrum populi]|uniref:hypothetical protein n=1 Tax=Methylorubrum populi TaxID=223967 RepID=UPI0031F90D40